MCQQFVSGQQTVSERRVACVSNLSLANSVRKEGGMCQQCVRLQHTRAVEPLIKTVSARRPHLPQAGPLAVRTRRARVATAVRQALATVAL